MLALGEAAAACCSYIAFQRPSFPHGAGLEPGKQPKSRGQPDQHLLLATSECCIYLAVSHHDHPDQHDVDVNAQGLVVINFIHLKKGGKQNREEVTTIPALKPLLSSTLPRSASYPSFQDRTRPGAKISSPSSHPHLFGGLFFFNFPLRKNHKVKKPSWNKPNFPRMGGSDGQ